MKIVLLIFGVFSIRWCFTFLDANLLSFIWLLPLLIILSIGLAWLGLKTVFEFFESC
jgi:hypothetical protein